MTRLLRLLLAIAALGAAAAPALAADPARQCFRLSQMKGHTVADSRTLYVAVAQRDVYRIEMAGACLSGANFGDPLVIENRGSDFICRPIDLDLKVAGAIGLSPCIVNKITRLTPAEIASLPPKLKP